MTPRNGRPLSSRRLRTVLGDNLLLEVTDAVSGHIHPDGAEYLAQEAAALSSVALYLADLLRDVSDYDGFRSALFISYRDLRLHAARRLREARMSCPNERTMVRHEYYRIRALNEAH